MTANQSQYNYGEVDIKACQTAMIQGNSRWHKVPQAGEIVFLCPPWAKEVTKPYHEVMVHWNIDSEGPVVCLRPNQCPVCDVNNEMRNRKEDTVAQNISKNIYAKPNYFYNIIAGLKPYPLADGKVVFAMADPGKEPKVEVWSTSKTVYEQITKLYEFNGNIHNPMNACLVQLNKIATGQGNISKIYVQLIGTRGGLDSKAFALLNGMADLSKELTPLPYEKLKNITDAAIARLKSTGGMVGQRGTSAPANTNPVPNAQPLPFNVVTTGPVAPQPVIITAPTIPQVVPSVPQAQAPVIITSPVPANSGMQAIEDFEKQLAARNAGK